MDHERIVLGSMMLNATVIDDATEVLTGTDFADQRHEVIFDAIVHLASSGKPTDSLAVADRLHSLGVKFDAAYLHECVQSVSVTQSCGYYAEQVKAAATIRRVVATGHALIELGTHADPDPLDILNAARARLDALIVDDADDTHESSVYAAIQSLDEPLGVPTPWESLDRIVAGWGPGMLYIVGARPGVGKTVFGIGVLLDMARRGKTAVMVSLEMPKSELYLRMLSTAGVPGDRIMHRRLDKEDHARMAKAAAAISLLPIVVDDRSALSLAQIRAKVKGVQRTRDVGVVVVDYLGLVKPPGDVPRNDRRVQVDAITQGLKELARDLRVPVVALAQLNRGIEGRAVKVPTLADLRESGGIEAAADVAILLHRDHEESPEELQVSIPKNRHGPQGQFRLAFRGQFSRIDDHHRAWQDTA